ncbi:MAG TPA: hypothetical protein ENO00_03020 [Deltaproteobacteria bacterium]|nr:hypothetical protein [Deltaproteobacteria bacterium]
MGFDHEQHDKLVSAILDAFPGSTITYSRTNRQKIISGKRTIRQYRDARAYLGGRHRGEDDRPGRCTEPSSAELPDDNKNMNRRSGDRGGV